MVHGSGRRWAKSPGKREFAPVRKRSRPRGKNAWSRQTWRYSRLDCGGDGQQAAVGAVLADQHEADRCIAGALTRDRDGAAVEEVRDPWIAQDEKVGVAVGVVRGKIGDPRRGHGDGGHDQGVVGCRDGGKATDEIGPRRMRTSTRGSYIFSALAISERWIAKDSAAAKPPLALICGSSASSRKGISTMRAPALRSAASAPMESSEVESGNAPTVGTRCAVGLNPTTPHNAAGMRHEPPVSVPSAPYAMPSLTDTAAPEDEPPGMRAAWRS